LTTGIEIVRKETPLGLYKGLGAVLTGIIPKMAIRFTSFEAYKRLLANKETGKVTGQATFVGNLPRIKPKFDGGNRLLMYFRFAAGLGAGITEAVAVVTPMEVIKIRLQAQHHSMADPLDIPKYRNAAHALYTVVKEEGIGALYRGVSLTALRQGKERSAAYLEGAVSADTILGSNQAVNFTAYTEFKKLLQKWQPQYKDTPIPSYQTTIIGLISGAMGPLSNAPIDTIKTRLQKMPARPGETALSRITSIARDMFK
jgi:solute carrier family 25 citrate transporter 1